MVSAAAFAVSAEQKQGQIRSLKLQQLDYKISQEEGKVEQERVKSEIEWRKVDTLNIKLEIEEARYSQTEYQLQGELSKVEIEAVKASIEETNLTGWRGKAELVGQQWDVQLEAMRGEIEMARQGSSRQESIGSNNRRALEMRDDTKLFKTMNRKPTSGTMPP